MSTELEVAWAAGLFEGEGSIHIRPSNAFIAAELTSTDEDVVEHFGSVVGIGIVTLRSRTAGMKPHWKDRWSWRAQAMEAVVMIDLLAPYFGQRRSGRAAEARQRYLAWVDEKTPERTCPECQEPFRPHLRGHTRQVYCDGVCRAAAAETRRLAQLGRIPITGGLVVPGKG